MAQTINSTTSNGLFSASAFDFTALNSDNFSSDVSDCKDPITVIVDTTADKSNAYSLVCVGTDGKKKEVKLEIGSVNAIHITTFGYKNTDGMMDFEITGGASAGIKVAVLKYTSVVNH